MKLFLCPQLLLLAILVISPVSRGTNHTSWQGFILTGFHYQFYTGTLLEHSGMIITQIELTNVDCQPVFIGLDEEDSGSLAPAEPVIEYSQLNQNGVRVNLLDEGDSHTINLCARLYPLYYLLSLSFHELLNQIKRSGKPINAHLVNPLSPDNSAAYHLTLSQSGSVYTVTAHPINSQGQIQYTNSAMIFRYWGGLNWMYYIDQTLIAAEARQHFYRYRLFQLGNSIIIVALLGLFVQKQSVSVL